MRILLLLLISINSLGQFAVKKGIIKRTNTSGIVYAQWNPSDKSTNITLSISNTKANCTSNATSYQVRSNVSHSTGKWYWEITFVRNSPSDPFYLTGGISEGSESVNNYTGSSAGVTSTTDGQVWEDGASVGPTVGAWTDGDVAGWALDLTGGSETIKIYRNNTLLTTRTINAATYYAGTGTYATLGYSIANFGATAMVYTAPSGYNQGWY